MRTGRGSLAAVVAAAAIAQAGCAATGSGPATPDPSAGAAQLFEPGRVYRQLGFLASGPPLPFVGSVHFLAAGDDSAFVLVAVSMASDVLDFRRVAQGYEARYSAEVVVRDAGRIVAQRRAGERVRVASRQETQRSDESVLFQQFVALPPGQYTVTVTIRDDQTGSVGRGEEEVRVPDSLRATVAGPVPVYQAAGRDAFGAFPALLLNPRATVVFGLDTLKLYLERRSADAPDPVRVELVDPAGVTVAARAGTFSEAGEVRWALVEFPPEELPLGEFAARVAEPGIRDAAVPALVTLSDQWAITDFAEILSLLRYFGWDRERAALEAADPGARAGKWREFWTATDPFPATARHEALEEYFERLKEADRRFVEAGERGWLTERGEVYIVLGEPDEVLEESASLQGRERTIRWTYVDARLVLDFVDDTGFGRFRLTAPSRSDFERERDRRRSER